jgi:general secretion pathway protein G
MNLPNKKFNSKGFTLIELLVVVAIISLLSSVVLASLNTARSKARDAVRKTELKELQTALEMYYNANGAYPICNWCSSEPGDPNYTTGNYIPGLAPTYIPILPKDPRGGVSSMSACSSGGYKQTFTYVSDGVNYKLLSHCAPENSWTSSDSFYDPMRPTWAWKVCNAEPACSSW